MSAAVDNARVFIVSDSLGETAELVTRAAMSQFETVGVTVRRFPMVKDASGIEDIVREARAGGATLIVYTLILPEVNEAMRRHCEAYGVESVDIMGPMLSGLVQVLNRLPRFEAGRVRRMDEDYFRRVDCVEFAVKYDDCRDPRGFLQADVVLVGLSRASKTPTAMYLAHRNVKVATLPLVPELALPREILQVPPWRIVGLRVDPQQLARIRHERVRTMHMPNGDRYADLARILEELDYAERTFKRLGCPVIDVTHRAVEEAAVLVMNYLESGARLAAAAGLHDPHTPST
jgi:regulator of PEP synthase PpsR (kinase-PPPase family)